MRCLKQKELILLYYNEVTQEKAGVFRSHIKGCSRCAARYSELEQFMHSVDTHSVDVPYKEIEEYVDFVSRKAYEVTPRQRGRKEILSSFLQNIGDGLYALFLRPRLALVTVAVITALILFPLWKKKNTLDKEFDIFQIQMELTLNEEDLIELFDFFGEDFIDSEYLLLPPTPGNSV